MNRLAGLSAVPAPADVFLEDIPDQSPCCCRLDLATASWVTPDDLCTDCRDRRRRLLLHTCPDCGAFVLPQVLRNQGRCSRCADPHPLF